MKKMCKKELISLIPTAWTTQLISLILLLWSRQIDLLVYVVSSVITIDMKSSAERYDDVRTNLGFFNFYMTMLLQLGVNQ